VLTYLKRISLFETVPTPSILISRVESLSPGLDPVVQVTESEVAADTGHSMPSMMMVYLEVSSEKLVPEKVTSVPPVTVPYLGLTALRAGVIEPAYSTSFSG
jgi:hypothetical protein